MTLSSRNHAPTLDQLTDALLSAAPQADGHRRTIAGALYRLLAQGEPVKKSTLAAATALSLDEVRAALDAWPGIYRDDNDNIVGFWGLALSETMHSFQVNDRQLYAWCAWDTLFLPGVLHTAAHVESRDPNSGETVRLILTPQAIVERSHDGMVMSFLAPDERLDGDVISNFCHYVNFFTDADSAAPWLGAHEGTFLLELDDAFELGRRSNTARSL